MQQIDSFYVKESDDEGGERYYFRIKSCPCAAECSDRIWQRVQATSFISADKCKDLVKMHLMHSDRHRKKESDADAILKDIDPEMLVETAGDRKLYRNSIDKTNAKKRPREEETTEGDDDAGARSSQSTAGARSSKGKGKKGKGKNVRKGIQIYKGGGEERELAVRHHAQPTTVPEVTAQSLGLLVDCIDRSRRTIQSAQKMFAKATEAFNERAQACSVASSSLLDEYNALGQARECVRDMQLTMQANNR